MNAPYALQSLTAEFPLAAPGMYEEGQPRQTELLPYRHSGVSGFRVRLTVCSRTATGIGIRLGDAYWSLVICFSMLTPVQNTDRIQVEGLL